MIDRKSAAQLLKTKWSDPSALARELYSIVVSRAEKVVDSPVVFEIPKGGPPLIIRRSSSPERPPGSTSSQSAAPQSPAAEASPQEPPRQRPPANPDSSRPKPQEPSVGRAKSSILSDPFRGTIVELARRPDPFGPQSPTTRSPQPPAASQIASRATAEYPSFEAPPSGGDPSRPVPIPDTPKGTRDFIEGLASADQFQVKGSSSDYPTTPMYIPRSNPISPPLPAPPRKFNPDLSLEGPAEFRSPEATRFQVEPHVYRPTQADFRPITEWLQEQIAHMRRPDYGNNPLVAKVISGTGKKWRATVYQLKPVKDVGTNADNDPTAQDVDLIVLNASDNFVAPVDSYVGPIIELSDPYGAADNNFFLILDPFLGGYGVVTVQIQAQVGGVPGVGTINVHTWDGSSALAVTSSMQCWTNMPSAVNVGKKIQYKYIEGRPFVDVADCP